jgi:hypothetical protein
MTACIALPLDQKVVKGESIDPEQTGFLKLGITTIDDMTKELGAPDIHWLDENILIYEWTVRTAAFIGYGGFAGIIPRYDFLIADFNQDGILINYQLSWRLIPNLGQLSTEMIAPREPPAFICPKLSPIVPPWSDFILAPPSKEQQEYIKNGDAVLVLLRIVLDQSTTTPNALNKATISYFDLEARGFFCTGRIVPVMSFSAPSKELSHQGWVYFVLPKETHFIRLAKPLPDSKRREPEFLDRDEPWWRLDLSKEHSIVYVGTMVVDAQIETNSLGRHMVKGINSIEIIDETVVAQNVLKKMQMDTKRLTTQTVKEKTDETFYFKTPMRESGGP